MRNCHTLLSQRGAVGDVSFRYRCYLGCSKVCNRHATCSPRGAPPFTFPHVLARQWALEARVMQTALGVTAHRSGPQQASYRRSHLLSEHTQCINTRSTQSTIMCRRSLTKSCNASKSVAMVVMLGPAVRGALPSKGGPSQCSVQSMQSAHAHKHTHTHMKGANEELN